MNTMNSSDRIRAFLRNAVKAGLLVIIPMFSTGAFAEEKSARVVTIGSCWTGYQTVIVTMDNGDRLTLGNHDDQLTRTRLAMAMAAKTSGESVFYQISGTTTICSISRGNVDWWSVGGSIF